jgi:hypothetical protein
VQRVLSAKKEDIRGCGTIERPRNFILKHFATAKFIFPKNIRAKASFLKTNIGETLKISWFKMRTFAKKVSKTPEYLLHFVHFHEIIPPKNYIYSTNFFNSRFTM